MPLSLLVEGVAISEAIAGLGLVAMFIFIEPISMLSMFALKEQAASARIGVLWMEQVDEKVVCPARAACSDWYNCKILMR